MNRVPGCEQNEEVSLWMSLALDGRLSADQRMRLDRHLVDCPACQAEWKVMQMTSDWLAESPMVGPPLGFAVRIDRRLEESSARRRRLLGGLAAATSGLSLAGATLVVLAVIGLALVVGRWGGASVAPSGQVVVSQMASGLGLVGKGASLFLRDLFIRFGFPLVLVLGALVTYLAGLWLWLFLRRPRSQNRGEYAGG